MMSQLTPARGAVILALVCVAGRIDEIWATVRSGDLVGAALRVVLLLVVGAVLDAAVGYWSQRRNTRR
jgi:hypothetical protein